MEFVEQSAKLIWMTAEPEKMIERASRTCYKSEDRITEGSAYKMVRMLLEKGHEAMIEHASASVLAVTDRGVSHEIVRHRLASYAQESTRYVNYGKTNAGIKLSPMFDHLTEAQIERRLALYRHIEEVYLAEIDEGIKPQQARDNLPTCTKTEIVMTYNFREWRHFFSLRKVPTAHPRMQQLATLIHGILVVEAPAVFGG